MCLLAHVLAIGFVGLQFASSWPSTLCGGRCGLDCICAVGWGPWGRLQAPGGAPTLGYGRSSGRSHSSQWGTTHGDPGRAVGVGLQIGEETDSRGRWTRLATVGGPGPLERSSGGGAYYTQCAQGGDDGCARAEDEVLRSLGPGRRVGVHHTLRDAEAGVVGGLHQPHGGPPFGTGGPKFGAGGSPSEETCSWVWALRGLQRVLALRQEGSSISEVPDLHPHAGGLLGTRDTWTQQLRSEEGQLQGL